MSNNKQSSVELLIEQLEEKGELRDCTSLGLIQLNIDKNDYLALKEQAKAMHKQEIEQAFDRGRLWNMSWDGNSYYEEIIIKGNNE